MWWKILDKYIGSFCVHVAVLMYLTTLFLLEALGHLHFPCNHVKKGCVVPTFMHVFLLGFCFFMHEFHWVL